MIVKIPTITKRVEDDKVVKERGEMPVEVDTSFLAHLKWEEKFQEQMGVDLSTYTERVRKWLKDEKKAKANMVGLLKLLYCYVNSDKLPTFTDFVKLFDYEVADEILNKIGVVLEEAGEVASKN